MAIVASKKLGWDQRLALPEDLTLDSRLEDLNDRLPPEHKLDDRELAVLTFRSPTIEGALRAWDVDPFGDHGPRMLLWEFFKTNPGLFYNAREKTPYSECSGKTAALASALKAHLGPTLCDADLARLPPVRTHRLQLPPFIPMMKATIVSPLDDELFDSSMAIDNLPDELHEAAYAAAQVAQPSGGSSSRRPATIGLSDVARVAAAGPASVRKGIVSVVPRLGTLLGPAPTRDMKAELVVASPTKDTEQTIHLAEGLASLTIQSEISYGGLHEDERKELWATRSVRVQLDLPPDLKIAIEQVPVGVSQKGTIWRSGRDTPQEIPLRDGVYRVRVERNRETVSEERLVLTGIGSEYVDLSRYVGYELRSPGHSLPLAFDAGAIPSTAPTRRLYTSRARRGAKLWPAEMDGPGVLPFIPPDGENVCGLPPGLYRVPLSSKSKNTSAVVFLEVFPGGLARARVLADGMQSEAFDVFGGRATPNGEYRVRLRGKGREETRRFQFRFPSWLGHPREIHQLQPRASARVDPQSDPSICLSMKE